MECVCRGPIAVKGKGTLTTYFVISPQESSSLADPKGLKRGASFYSFKPEDHGALIRGSADITTKPVPKPAAAKAVIVSSKEEAKIIPPAVTLSSFGKPDLKNNMPANELLESGLKIPGSVGMKSEEKLRCNNSPQAESKMLDPSKLYVKRDSFSLATDGLLAKISEVSSVSSNCPDPLVNVSETTTVTSNAEHSVNSSGKPEPRNEPRLVQVSPPCIPRTPAPINEVVTGGLRHDITTAEISPQTGNFSGLAENEPLIMTDSSDSKCWEKGEGSPSPNYTSQGDRRQGNISIQSDNRSILLPIGSNLDVRLPIFHENTNLTSPSSNQQQSIVIVNNMYSSPITSVDLASSCTTPSISIINIHPMLPTASVENEKSPQPRKRSTVSLVPGEGEKDGDQEDVDIIRRHEITEVQEASMRTYIFPISSLTDASGSDSQHVGGVEKLEVDKPVKINQARSCGSETVNFGYDDSAPKVSQSLKSKSHVIENQTEYVTNVLNHQVKPVFSSSIDLKTEKCPNNIGKRRGSLPAYSAATNIRKPKFKTSSKTSKIENDDHVSNGKGLSLRKFSLKKLDMNVRFSKNVDVLEDKSNADSNSKVKIAAARPKNFAWTPKNAILPFHLPSPPAVCSSFMTINSPLFTESTVPSPILPPSPLSNILFSRTTISTPSMSDENLDEMPPLLNWSCSSRMDTDHHGAYKRSPATRSMSMRDDHMCPYLRHFMKEREALRLQLKLEASADSGDSIANLHKRGRSVSVQEDTFLQNRSNKFSKLQEGSITKSGKTSYAHQRFAQPKQSNCEIFDDFLSSDSNFETASESETLCDEGCVPKHGPSGFSGTENKSVTSMLFSTEHNEENVRDLQKLPSGVDQSQNQSPSIYKELRSRSTENINSVLGTIHQEENHILDKKLLVSSNRSPQRKRNQVFV